MVHTNVAGDIFAACKALRLAPFFQQLQASLARRANRADPTIALLTPGPRHNDFFSHAYLARYLGLLLVEGGDLRVTGDRVSLKTLHGLMPDRPDRALRGRRRGRPAGARRLGLRRTGRPAAGGPQASRLRRQCAGIRARREPRPERLPAEARQDGAGRGAADPGRAALVARRSGKPRSTCWPTSSRWSSARRTRARRGRAAPSPGIDPARLAAAERDTLLQEIEIRGAALVAEEKVGFGTTPSLTPAGLVPKPYALRLFVTATSNGFAVMPGGLAMTVDPDATVALSAPDGESRDVWVVSDAPPPPLHQPVAADHRGRQVRRAPARPAEPGRRQPVLARPLHRARRLDHARAAHLPRAACRRTARRARSCAPAAPRSRSCSPRTTARCPASGSRPTPA